MPGLAHYADGTKEERKEVHGSEGAKDKADAIEGDNFGGHRDSMPRGPRSVGLDIAFPYAQHVYGEITLTRHIISLIGLLYFSVCLVDDDGPVCHPCCS